jgi:hypothetical protein
MLVCVFKIELAVNWYHGAADHSFFFPPLHPHQQRPIATNHKALLEMLILLVFVLIKQVQTGLGYDLHSNVTLSSNSTWSLITGSTSSAMPSRNFGTALYSSSSVSPGTVRAACSAVDPIRQVLFTFGGCWYSNCAETYNDIANSNYAGALWMLDLSTLMWTFIGGTSGNGGDSCCTNMIPGNNFSSTSQFPGPRVYCQMTANAGIVYLYGGFGRGQYESGGTAGVAGDLWAHYISNTSSTDFSSSQVRLMPNSVFESSGTDYSLTYTSLGSFSGTKAPFRLGGALHYVNYAGEAHLLLHGGHVVTAAGQFEYMYADTWLYRLRDYAWAWVAGMSTSSSSTCPSSALPLLMGTGSPYPRSNFASCVSPDGSFVYMFGGITRVCTGSTISRKTYLT